MKRFAAAIVLTLGCAGLGAQTPDTTDICARTQIIQTRILEATPADDACDAVATSELQAITELRFGFDELTSIQLGDFSGLTGLQTLRIMDPAVLLPANIFSELSNLQTLILEAGVFLRLQSGAFSGLNNLRTLNFSGSLHTSQRQLPANIFSGLINLQTLNFSGNPHLETLPDNVFSGLTNLRTLNLRNNYRLRMLPTGVFRGLTSLTSVRLEKIPNLANPMPLPFTFTVRPEITYFQSAGETVSSVRLTLREGAPRPITAALSATGATLSTVSLTIQTGHVESATTVTMTRLPGSTSAVLTISELTLGGSNGNYDGFNIVIGEAVTNICDRTSLVQTGILHGSGLFNFHLLAEVCSARPVSELAAITGLSFSSSGIMALRRDDFSMLTGLKTLNLEDNQLTELPPGIFAELTSLQTLNLADNELEELPPGIFAGLTDLRTVHLFDNPGASFRLVLHLESADETALSEALPAFEPAQVRLTLAEGAPYPLEVRFDEVSGVTLSTNPVTIPAGATRSGEFMVTRDGGADSFRIGFAELPPPNNCDSDHRHEGRCYTGIEVSGSPIVYAPDRPGPQVSTIRFISVPQNPNTYRADAEETIDVDVVFDRGIIVTSDGVPSLTLVLRIGGSGGVMTYVPGRSGGDVLSFSYTLMEHDVDREGINVEGVLLNGVTLTDIFGRHAGVTLDGRFRAERPGHRVWNGAFLGFTDSAGTIAVPEGGTAVEVFNLDVPFDVPLEEPLSVHYTITGDSADADDYDAGSGVVTVPAGSTTGEIRIFIRDDEDIEPPRERFFLNLDDNLDDSDGYALGTKSSVTIVIKEGICDRTPLIIDRIQRKINPIVPPSCEDVRSADLDGVDEVLAGSQGVESLKSKDFSGLSNVTSVTLSGNQLMALPPKLLDGLVGLTSLSLSQNQLTALPDLIFSGLTGLETLLLDDNALSALPEGIFSDLRALRILRLENNQLDALPPGAFSGLSNLEVLHLSDNLGTTFRLTLRLESADETALSEALLTFDPAPARLALPAGAPYPLEVRFEVSGVTLSTNPVTISAGSTQSALFTVTRSGESFSIGFAELSPPPDNCPSLHKIGGRCFTGFEIAPDETGPQVSTIRFTSSPQNPPAYSAESGETIDVDVVFGGELTVTSDGVALPTLTLQIGDNPRTATYVPGRSGGDVLSFSYTLMADDFDEDGVSVAPVGLQLNGSTVTGVFGPADLTLAPRFFADQPEHKVALRGVSLSFTDSGGTTAAPEGGTAVAVFNLDVPFDLPLGAPLAVHYVVTGDSADADDYDAGSGVVTVPAGSTTGEIRIFIRDDEDAEPPRERFFLNLTDSADYALGAETSVTIVIKEGICDRTPVVIQRIQRKIYGLTPPPCEDVRSADLNRLTETLSIRQGAVTTLKSKDFFGLSNLPAVSLSNNPLMALPPKLLDGLVRLMSFEILRTPLTTLPDASFFSGLTNLDVLLLNENALSALPEGIFSGLRSLRILRLENNQLDALPPGAFSGLSNLSVLHLSDNPGTTFRLTLRLESADETEPSSVLLTSDPVTARLALPAGAPYPLEVRFEVSGVTLSTNPVTISAGGTRSATFTMTRSGESFSIGFAELSPPPDNCPSLHKIGGRCFTGFEIAPDGTGPRVSTIRFTSSPRNPPAYSAESGETIDVEVVFDRGVIVTSDGGASPTLGLRIGFLGRFMTYVPGRSGGNVLSFSYTLMAGDFDEDGVNVEGVLLNGATLTDIFGRAADLTLAPHFFADQPEHKVAERDVSLSFTDSDGTTTAPEGGTAVAVFNLDVSFDLPLGAPLAVHYVVTGDSADADDYDAGSGVVTVPAGSTAGEIRIFIRDDEDVEPPRERFFLNLDDSDDYALGAETSVTIVIKEGICDRTPLIIDRIQRKINPIVPPSCEDVRSADLDGVDEVLAGSQGVESLKSKDFSGLSNVTSVTLSRNRLTALPPNLFDSLVGLTSLSLSQNQLTTLPGLIFSGLTGLETLLLDDNALSALPEGVFSDFRALRTLRLDQNQLTALPPGVFSGLSSLETLHLSANPGAPFRLTLRLESAGETELSSALLTFDPVPARLALPAGAPYPLEVRFEVSGVTLSTNPVTISAGSTQSALFTVTRSGGSFSIGFAELSPPLDNCPSAGRIGGQCFTGVEIAPAPGIVHDEAVNICARTDAVEAAILAATPADDACEAVLESELRATTELNLAGSGIASLQADDFSSLTSLQTLNLADNGLGELPPGIFAGLTGLQALDLSGNELTELPAGVFAETANLQTLNLADNGLNELPAGVFTQLTGLRTLSLSGNNLNTLPAGVFTRLTGLRTLDLAGNGLNELPAGVFTQLTGLRTLDLSGNNLNTLPAGVFTQLSDLRTLDLAGNGLNGLPAGVFAGLVNLTGVDLSGNSGTTFTLTVRPEVEMSQVSAGSVVSSVRLMLSEGAPRSVTVDIAAVGATPDTDSVTIPTGSIASDAFAVTSTSENVSFRLSLTVSQLGGEDGNYPGIAITTEALSVGFTNICARTEVVRAAILDATSTVGDACEAVFAPELRTITDLHLSGAGITSLQPGDFSGLTGLRTLNLSSNDLNTLPVGVFSDLTGLQLLDLANNGLSELPADAFTRLSGLWLLNLRFNNLNTLPVGVFSGLTNLRGLDLADNGLDELPAGVFAGLAGLTGVHLSGNPGTTFMLTVRAETDMFRTSGGFTASSVKLVLSEGAPRAITVDFSTVGASPSSGFLTIPTGSTESGVVVIVHAFGRTSAVLTWEALALGGADADYSGFDVDLAAETITSVDTQTVYLTLSDLVVEQGGSGMVRVAVSPPFRPGQSAAVSVMIPDALFGDDSSGQARAYFTDEASSDAVTFELDADNQFRDIRVHVGAGLTGAGFGGSVADPTPGIYEQGIAGRFSAVAGFSNPVPAVSSPLYGRILVGLRHIEVGFFDQSGVSPPLPLTVTTNAPGALRLMQTDAPLRGSQAAALRINVEGAGLGVSRSLGGAASGSLDVTLNSATSAVDFFVSASQEGVSGTLTVAALGTSGVGLRAGRLALPVRVPVGTRVFFVPSGVTLAHGLEQGGAGPGAEVEVRTDPLLQAGDPALRLVATLQSGIGVEPVSFNLTPENPTTTVRVFLVPEERSGFFTGEITLSNRNAADPQEAVREAILVYEPLRVTAVRTVVVSLEKTDAGSPFVVGEEATVTVATAPALAAEERVLVSLTAGAGLTVVGDSTVALSEMNPSAEITVRSDDSGERTLEAAGVGTNVAVSSGASLTVEVLGRLALRFEPSRLRVEQGRSATFNVTTSPQLTGSDSATVRLTAPSGWGLGERRDSSLELSLDAATPTTAVRVTAPDAALGPVSVGIAQQAAGFVFSVPSPLEVEAFRVLPLSFGALTAPVVAGGGRSTALLALGNAESLLAGERLTVLLEPSGGLELVAPASGMVVMDGGPSSRVETSLRAKLDASLSGESLRASLVSLEPPARSSYTRVDSGVLEVPVGQRMLTGSFSPPEVTLVRGGAAPSPASTRVTLGVSPELQGGEQVEVNLTPGGGLGVDPEVVTLSSAQRTVEVSVSADLSAADGEVSAAAGAGTSVGGASVSFEALRVEVIRGVALLLGGSSSPAALAFTAGQGADLLVSTTPTLETGEEVTVRLSVPSADLVPDVVLLNAANPEVVVRVNTDTPDLRTTVAASGTGAGVAVVGDEATQRIRTSRANELSLEVSPSEVLVEQASSARVTVTTSPALASDQAVRVRLELAGSSGLSFTGGMSSVEVALDGQVRDGRALLSEVPVFASVEAAIGSTAAMMVTQEAVSEDVVLILPSPAPFLRVAPPRVSVGLAPEGGELGEAVALALDATGRVILSLTDYTLSGGQRAVLEARIEGPGLSLIEGGVPVEVVEVILTPMARTATLTLRSSSEALPGVLRVRAIDGVELKAPASVRIDARQTVAPAFTPSPLMVEQGRSTELRVESVSPIAPNRSATVTLTAPAGVLLDGAASTDLVLDAASQSRTVKVAALHSAALGAAALDVEVQQTPGLLLVSPPSEVTLKVVVPRVAVSLTPPMLSLAQEASGEVGLRLRDYELMGDQQATLRVTTSSGLTLSGGASEREVLLSAQARVATVTVSAGMTSGVERLRVSALSGVELSQDAVLEVLVLQRVTVRFAPAMIEVRQGRETRLRVTTEPALESGWSVTVGLSVDVDSGVRFDGGASTELTLSGDGAGSQEVVVSALPDAGIGRTEVEVSLRKQGVFALASAPALSVAVVLPAVSVSLTPARELVLESGSVLESSKEVVLRLERSELPATQSVSLRVRLDSDAGLSLSPAGPPSIHVGVQTDLSLNAESDRVTVTVHSTPNVTGTGTLTVTAMEGVRLRPELSLAITVTTPNVSMSFEPAQLMFEPEEEEGMVTVRLCRAGRSDVASCASDGYPLVPAQDVRLEASASEGLAFVEVPSTGGVTIENGMATLAFGGGKEEIEMTIEFTSDEVKEGELVFRAVRGVVLVNAAGEQVEPVLEVLAPSTGTRLRIRVFLEGALE